jgi:chromosome segregation ATPase
VSDLQQQLDHQMRISELLAEQLETSKASIESKTGVIDSMKQELGDKQQHIRSLEAALKKKRKSGSSNSQASDNTAAIQRRIRKELEEEIYDLQRRLRKEQSMHRKSKNKITKLEDELDDQLADWVALENEMDETKAYLAEIESQLAKEEAKKRNLERKEKEEEKAQVKEKGKKEKKPRRSSVSASNSGEDFNLYLDSLTRKVRDARNQLETAHGRLDQAVSRHRIANREPVYSA